MKLLCLSERVVCFLEQLLLPAYHGTSVARTDNVGATACSTEGSPGGTTCPHALLQPANNATRPCRILARNGEGPSLACVYLSAHVLLRLLNHVALVALSLSGAAAPRAKPKGRQQRHRLTPVHGSHTDAAGDRKEAHGESTCRELKDTRANDLGAVDESEQPSLEVPAECDRTRHGGHTEESVDTEVKGGADKDKDAVDCDPGNKRRQGMGNGVWHLLGSLPDPLRLPGCTAGPPSASQQDHLGGDAVGAAVEALVSVFQDIIRYRADNTSDDAGLAALMPVWLEGSRNPLLSSEFLSKWLSCFSYSEAAARIYRENEGECASCQSSEGRDLRSSEERPRFSLYHSFSAEHLLETSIISSLKSLPKQVIKSVLGIYSFLYKENLCLLFSLPSLASKALVEAAQRSMVHSAGNTDIHHEPDYTEDYQVTPLKTGRAAAPTGRRSKALPDTAAAFWCFLKTSMRAIDEARIISESGVGGTVGQTTNSADGQGPLGRRSCAAVPVRGKGSPPAEWEQLLSLFTNRLVLDGAHSLLLSLLFTSSSNAASASDISRKGQEDDEIALFCRLPPLLRLALAVCGISPSGGTELSAASSDAYSSYSSDSQDRGSNGYHADANAGQQQLLRMLLCHGRTDDITCNIPHTLARGIADEPVRRLYCYILTLILYPYYTCDASLQGSYDAGCIPLYCREAKEAEDWLALKTEEILHDPEGFLLHLHGLARLIVKPHCYHSESDPYDSSESVVFLTDNPNDTGISCAEAAPKLSERSDSSCDRPMTGSSSSFKEGRRGGLISEADKAEELPNNEHKHSEGITNRSADAKKMNKVNGNSKSQRHKLKRKRPSNSCEIACTVSKYAARGNEVIQVHDSESDDAN